MQSSIVNCYRAILAQLNQLDSISFPRTYTKDLYMDLSELAYYLLEKDEHIVYKSVKQMYETAMEVNNCNYSLTDEETKCEITYLLAEIKTHLEYLVIELNEKVRA